MHRRATNNIGHRESREEAERTSKKGRQKGTIVRFCPARSRLSISKIRNSEQATRSTALHRWVCRCADSYVDAIHPRVTSAYRWIAGCTENTPDRTVTVDVLLQHINQTISITCLLCRLSALTITMARRSDMYSDGERGGERERHAYRSTYRFVVTLRGRSRGKFARNARFIGWHTCACA